MESIWHKIESCICIGTACLPLSIYGYNYIEYSRLGKVHHEFKHLEKKRKISLMRPESEKDEKEITNNNILIHEDSDEISMKRDKM